MRGTPIKNKFKIHNSVNADDINKDETAGEHTTACTEVSRDLCKSRDDASGCVFTPTALWCADIALVGDTALTISALIDEIKAQTGGKGAGDRAAVESEVAALKGLWLKEWCALQTTHPCASARAFCAVRCRLAASRFCFWPAKLAQPRGSRPHGSRSRAVTMCCCPAQGLGASL